MTAAPGEAVLPRLLVGAQTGRALDLGEHIACHGRAARRGPELIDAVSRAGLRGRGGAAFPTAIKLEAVAQARRAPIVVANGAEGEPASAKDRLLLESLPHLVLDGSVLAAEAVGARECIVCVEETAEDAAAALRTALAERAATRHDSVAVRLARTPEHYLAGEESALVHFLNGGPLKPTFVPPRPFERGVEHRPTLIQNVETLAHIALIARHGSHWFREVGTASEPGSTLVTLSGSVRDPGVYEIARGTAMADLLRAAGGATDDLTAVLVGGYFGSWVAGSELAALRLEDAELAAHDAALGSGVVVAFGASACGPAEVARVARFLASQSADQCGPCRFGLPAIAGALESAVAGRAGSDVWEDLGRWLRQVHGRGACHHPNGAVRFVTSALVTFSREWEDHVAHGPCEACARAALLRVPPAGAAATAA